MVSITFTIIALLLCVVGLAAWFFHFRHYEYTRDSYVMGNQVMMTPLHNGIVTSIHSDNSFLVKKGQLLITLDDSIAKLRLKEAKDQLGSAVRRVCQMYHRLFALESEIEMRKAEYIRALQDMEHREGVIGQGGVSIEDYEHAEAALRETFYALKRAKSLYQRQKAMIRGVSIKDHPLVSEAIDRVVDAWIYLFRCKIYAPVEGLVAQRKVQVGMYVEDNEPLLAIIPLDQIWVDANYKETQMKNMRIGQEVRLVSDYYGEGVVYHGEIVGLPGGAGNAFSILPPQNLSGNWIKIVQRLPVRVRVNKDQLRLHPLRIGLTMRARVDIRNTSGDMIPTTTEGSPHYETSVLKEEERGSQEAVDEVFEANLDPDLAEYSLRPLFPKQEVTCDDTGR